MSSAVRAESMAFAHQPVMLQEVVELVAATEPLFILDCTVGGGGHARALLERCPKARLVGIDRDPEAVCAARQALASFGERVIIVHAHFARVRDELQRSGIARVDALIADLGVSSYQLDTAERGFSFRADSTLDMRMDPTSGRTAQEVCATLSIDALADALRELGEERYARRVARAIAHRRPATTFELANLVRGIVPRARDGLDPSTRTFQAIRMLVNDEVAELQALLEAIPDLLADHGIAVVLSFHSIEDRLVKEAFRRAARGCVCPPRLPVCVCGRIPTLKLVSRRVMRPTAIEVARNPRAASTRLRAVRRLPRVA